MNKNTLALVCLLILFSCNKSDDDSNVVDNVVDNSEYYAETILKSAMGIWERNEPSVGKFVYVIYGESKFIYMDAIFLPIDEEGFYETQYLDVSADTKNKCLIYEAENALYDYTKDSPKRGFQEPMPGYSDGIIKSISTNELSIDGRRFTRVTKNFSIADVEGNWIRYGRYGGKKPKYLKFKSGQVETNFENLSISGGISKGGYSVDLNKKHSYAWARQYDLGGINIAIDYTEYWSYYHASFFILTDYLGCYNGDYYFYKPTN